MKIISNEKGQFFIETSKGITYLSLSGHTIDELKKDKEAKAHIKFMEQDNYYKYMPSMKEEIAL